MKYLIPLIVLLSSCTTPEIITLKDKDGNHIHSVSEESFFNTPDQASEWAFWYVPVVLIVGWFVWKEFKSMKFSKKNID